jgi:hypothetical protein
MFSIILNNNKWIGSCVFLTRLLFYETAFLIHFRRHYFLLHTGTGKYF